LGRIVDREEKNQKLSLNELTFRGHKRRSTLKGKHRKEVSKVGGSMEAHGNQTRDFKKT
jgi:hypothetical protein